MAKTKTKSAQTLFPALAGALLQLPATREGFEGLITGLVEAASGGRLALMSSGDQQGVDAVAPRGNAPRRAMQAKRYGPNTALDLNHLIGEMSRAQEGFAGLDCWILGTTQTVMGKELEALQRHAEARGLGFVPLDWSQSAGLPRLAALCAAYPEITTTYLTSAAVGAELMAIAGAAGFADAVRQLKRDLSAVDVGFEPARDAAAARLERAFHDPAAARHVAGASPAYLSKAPPVPRAKLAAQIGAWCAGAQQGLALLGGEGVGKTWAALVALRAAGAEAGGPLTVVLSSKAAGKYDDALAAVVGVLTEMAQEAGWTAENPTAFWRRRLSIWATTAGLGPQPRILLLIDGLDERDPFDWNDWAAPLLADRWRSLFRIVVACRQDDWTRRVKLKDFDDGQLLEIPVGLFSEKERDAFLTSQQVDLSQVSAQVLADALHPRTAYHLTRLGEEIGDYRRITREQILLRDFKNRHELKGGVADADAFKQVVVRMAQEAHQAALSQRAFTATEGEVLGHAATVTGHGAAEMRHVLSDLISGGWMQRDADSPHELTFTDKTLPLAVGMALAHEIRGKAASLALADIDRLLEPWSADDLVEPLLRTCATALITSNAPDALCLEVLRRWAGLRFHGTAARDFWRRLHVFRPELFLDLTEAGAVESHWLGEWGVACFWEDHPECGGLIESRLHRWLSKVGLPPAPETGDPRPLALRDRGRVRQLRRLARLEAGGARGWTELIGSEGVHHVSSFKRAVRVIGFLPRAPFVPMLTAWALSAAAAGSRAGFPDVAALLRDNTHDDAATMAAIDQVVAALLGAKNGLTDTAAFLLLQATGSPDRAARAAMLRPYRQFRKAPGRGAQFIVINDAGGPIVAFGDDAPTGGDRRFLNGLITHAGDWSIALSPPVQTEIDRIAAALDPANVPAWTEGERPLAAPLFRWALPQALAWIAAFIDGGPATQEEADLTVYAAVADRVFPALTAPQLDAAADFLDTDPAASPALRTQALTLRLHARPFSAQIALLGEEAPDLWPDRLEVLLRRPDDTTYFQHVRALDFAGPIDPLRSKLRLLAAGRHRWDPRGEISGVDWTAAFNHTDQTVRTLAIKLADEIGGEPAARALEPTGWTAMGKDAISAYEGSSVLAKLPDVELEPRLNRLGGEVLLRLYLDRPTLRASIEQALWTWVREALETRREQHTMGKNWCRFTRRDAAFALFGEANSNGVAEMLERVWADKGLRNNLLWNDSDGPGWPLLLCIASDHPDLVKRIWREATERNRFFSSSVIDELPSEMPGGPLFDDVRREMLDAVFTDGQLMARVQALQAEGHFQLLRACIAERLDGPRTIDRAWAITVAGFLTPTDPAQKLWAEMLATSPGLGWLDEVYAAARTAFSGAVSMRRWLEAVAQASDEAEAWTASRLLRLVADDRYAELLRDPAKPFAGKWERGRWLDFKSLESGESRKAARKALGDRWLHGPRYQETINGR